MPQTYLLWAAVLGFVGVAAGAFGAHGLKPRLSEEMLAVFETAVRYQMYHAAALLGTAWAIQNSSGDAALWAGRFFIAGTLIFSGSLYILSLTGIRWLGAVTPIGGVAFLAGWACLAWAAFSQGSA